MSKRPFDKARDETPPENNYFIDWGETGKFIQQKNLERALKEGAKLAVLVKKGDDNK